MTEYSSILTNIWTILAIDILPGISILNAFAWGGLVVFLVRRYVKK